MGSRLVQLLGPARANSPVAAGLADGVRSLVLDGRLSVGERLPSERALASELGRSRATVTAAYDRLEAAGYVSRVHGAGTRVALPHASRPVASSASTEVDFTISSTGSTPGLHEATLRALPRLASLRGGSGYSLPGLSELRERVAARYRERGVPTSADEIIITSGAMHGFALVLATLARPGRIALVEQPTFPHAIDALRRAGQRLVTTPVSPDGWDARHLSTTLLESRPHLAYLVPDFHNPTGATFPEAERDRLVATARAAGTTLVVDETCAELNIDRPDTPSPMAAFGDVITLGSMSKVAWGGLRVGWIRASRELVDRILAVRPTIDLGTAPLEQCITMELFEDVPALQRAMAARLAAGRDAVESGLTHLPPLLMPSTPGGLAVWIDLQEPVSTALSLAAHEHGLRIPPGPRFSASGVLERYLRIPITLEPEVTADGMRRLAGAWRDLHETGPLRGAVRHLTVV
ncbi:MocR-like transcription factor YczR [Microbacterium gorillae]|uniref:MocR-like transcription factor YczR n=1 Tax=Microbacterium gorillae TaxID=1231063 RepID=UPI00058B7DF9|nr:PLP-dependent aminotransferase family protein [Microbacterium gorillae]